MKNYFKALSIFILIMITLTSCKINQEQSSEKKSGTKTIKTTNMPGPPVIIYKTKMDYSGLVAVILSDDKSKIVSYPAISDIKRGNKYTYPTKLDNNYWLDNRGINKNVAFLELTYKEYGELEKTPSPDELFKKIIDNDPLTEFYKLGIRSDYKDIVNELNEIIRDKKLKN